MEDGDKLDLIIEASISGNEIAKEKLVKYVSARIETYIYRSTLDRDVTGDISQEVYCKMFDSLDRLRDFNAFWPWLYRISLNCINTHYRSKYRASKHFNLHDELLDSIVSDSKTSESDLLKKELGQAVIKAVATLKPSQRQMVTLRCFEDMSFREISEIEQTTEIYARVVFHRAIEKLRLALKKQGFSKASLVLALSLFGKLTASSEAAAAATSVTAASITGAGAAKGSVIAAKIAKSVGAISAHHVKVGVVSVSVAAIITILLTIGTLRSNVTSMHFFVQGVRPIDNPVAGSSSSSSPSTPPSSSSSSSSSSASFGPDRAKVEYRTMGAYEDKIIMPDGPDGAMLRFSQRWNIKKTGKLCSWLQDGSGNYYYASYENKIHIYNEPLRMPILPTDPPEFVEFFHSQVGYDSRVSNNYKFFSGLLKSRIDNRVSKVPDFKSEYEYNTLEVADLASTWPKTDDIVDERDEMHKRGWTSFEVDGLVNGKPVTGLGQIPFTYDMYADHKPWISIKADKDVYIDYPGAFAGAISDNEVLIFEKESFFEGFSRPWQGIPCIDSVMRDAAKRRLRFTLQQKNNKAEVTVFVDTMRGKMKIVYGIDREADVIDSILYYKDNDVIGQLYFKYMQDAASAEDEKFTPPHTDIPDKKGVSPVTPWLVTLAINI
ncbi:MAG: sigma-70 family RNA polymerase sigma factor [Phycisphaerae bacterium]|nr:sigma-70 family RNA polymerase sigma factor [Phycisphaerae bacterium]